MDYMLYALAVTWTLRRRVSALMRHTSTAASERKKPNKRL